MPSLRPGELKILTHLKEGEKRFTDLQNETDLSPTILSEYLKVLQKSGLVSRDVDTRKYRMREISVEILFFSDVLNFVEKRLEKMVKVGMEKSGIFPAGIGWVALTEDVGDFRESLEARLGEVKNTQAFARITEVIENLWDSYGLLKFNKKEKKTIQTYREYLLKFLKRLYKQEPSKQERRKTYEFLVQVTRAKLSSKYPGISIPERMIYIEATKQFKRLSKAHDVILQPYSLEKLFSTLKLLKKTGKIRDDLSEKEIDELKPIYEYLTNSRNKKVYVRYLERANKTPKTIVFYPSWGFKGYPEKIRELFSEAVTKARKAIYVDD